MNTKNILDRVGELISVGCKIRETKFESGSGVYKSWCVNSAKMIGFRSAVLSFIQRLYGDFCPYYQEFDRVTKNMPGIYKLNQLNSAIEILESIKSEIAGGWLFTVKGLISSEIFSDFLEMAEHLLDSGYKDSSAVMIGSVLENHLRQLSLKNNISMFISKGEKNFPKKADVLNSELASNSVYSKLDQKNVTAWLDLRNKAAHGNYDEYDESQVRNLLSNVANFISRNPL